MIKAFREVSPNSFSPRIVKANNSMAKLPDIQSGSGRFAQLPLDQNRRGGKEDRDNQTDAHAGEDAEPINQDSADNGCDHDRQSFDDGLNADTHGVAVGSERGADERKSRGQRETG